MIDEFELSRRLETRQENEMEGRERCETNAGELGWTVLTVNLLTFDGSEALCRAVLSLQ